MAKHPDHICRFNDGEQSCDCYDEGYRQAVADSNEKLVRVAERAVEQFKKELRENTTKKICTFYGNPKQELMVYLSDVLALLDSKEV